MAVENATLKQGCLGNFSTGFFGNEKKIDLWESLTWALRKGLVRRKEKELWDKLGPGGFLLSTANAITQQEGNSVHESSD